MTLPLFYMFSQILPFILPNFQQFLLKGMLLVSHKVVFVKNEAFLLCATMLERTRAFAATIQCITFDIAFAITKFTRIVFKIKIWHSCLNRVVRVALVLYSCRSCSTRVTLVLHLYCLCLTRVTFVSFVSHSCHLCLALVL